MLTTGQTSAGHDLFCRNLILKGPDPIHIYRLRRKSLALYNIITQQRAGLVVVYIIS